MSPLTLRRVTAGPHTGRPRRWGAIALVLGASLLCARDAVIQARASLQPGLNLFSLGGPFAIDSAAIGSTASGSDADGLRRGRSESVDLLTSGPTRSGIHRFGQENAVDVRQDGTGLVSIVEQGRASAGRSAFEAELAFRSEGADLFVGVSGNRAFIDQGGVNNRSVVGQFGDNSEVDVIQRGTGQVSRVFQSGNDSSVFVSQAGELNGSLIQQHDFAVRANVVQSGQGGLSDVRQWDQASGSIAQVFQVGARNMSDIDQAGVRNLAKVVQWDQAERSAATVIQDGDLGEVRVDQAGTELVSIVRQTAGLSQVADVFQAGSDQVSEVQQSGATHNALARQQGTRNRSTITQSGSGHVAVVIQSARSFQP